MKSATLIDIDPLTLIQITGIVLSGIGGGLATYSETRDKRHRLTVKGKWSLTLIAVGILLGCLGQIVANNESKSDTENSLATLKKETQEILSVATKFDSVKADAVIELSTNDAAIAKIRDDLERMATSNTNEIRYGSQSGWPVGISRGFTSVITVKPAQITNHAMLDEMRPIIGYMQSARFSLPIIAIDKSQETDDGAHKLNSKEGTYAQEYDVSMSNYSTNAIEEFRYSLLTHHFRFSIPFESEPEPSWIKHDNITGISDLTGAAIYFQTIWPYAQNGRRSFFDTNFQMVRCDLHFGRYPCSLSNIVRAVNPNNKSTISFKATLPNAELIQNYSAYKYEPF